jgi:hypothetical protein
MATVPEIPGPRKPTAYYAQLHGLSGVITKPAAAVLFLEPESGAVVTVTQADAPHLVVLGEVGASMAQYLDDMARGSAARIACARQQEVA